MWKMSRSREIIGTRQNRNFWVKIQPGKPSKRITHLNWDKKRRRIAFTRRTQRENDINSKETLLINRGNSVPTLEKTGWTKVNFVEGQYPVIWGYKKLEIADLLAEKDHTLA